MSHIFDKENEALTCLVSATELQGALWSLREDKALGSYGFSPLLSIDVGLLMGERW